MSIQLLGAGVVAGQGVGVAGAVGGGTGGRQQQQRGRQQQSSG